MDFYFIYLLSPIYSILFYPPCPSNELNRADPTRRSTAPLTHHTTTCTTLVLFPPKFRISHLPSQSPFHHLRSSQSPISPPNTSQRQQSPHCYNCVQHRAHPCVKELLYPAEQSQGEEMGQDDSCPQGGLYQHFCERQGW